MSRSSSVTMYEHRSPSSPLPPHSVMPDSQFTSPPSPTSKTASAKRYKYLRRILKYKQMDFEYAFWQMLYLFISPQKVYRNFQYRKQTKDQWARDDPAFLVLLTFWLLASSVGFTLVLHLNFLAFIKFFLWIVFVDCIGVGLVMATLLWFLSNRYLMAAQTRGQDVEWGYAFDVHLNAFFPLLIILHIFQLFFIHFIINHDGIVSQFVSNTLWLIALGYYIYITFLGYSALPFLRKTHVLLLPMTFLALTYVITLLVGWNASKAMCSFYEFRVV